ncbi:hypothetical protein [Corynebacterium variabile]|uniref:Uncharacterized protein n=1 Tax=Corynebacterium variabile TaxID=1727 RepID=A0A4Y4C8R5_9CORY|nr:hypothetical protein [Corynebacterium variabile]GEC87437.1 hypothetical protein CVA01_27510 [Corynebacterium variabile]
MTSPDLYQPNQPGRLEDIKPTISGLANIMLSNVSTIAQNIFRGIADAVAGLFKGQDGALGEISDGQLALADRYDLLDGVRGYCAAYQSLNINSEWNVLSSNDRYLPYESALGPTKGAHVETGRNIVFDEEGLWLVFVQAHARSTGYTGGNLSAIYVTILGPTGNVIRDVVFDTPGGADHTSLGGTFPVVIPEAGCWIRVRAWSGKWRWWDGGARNAWMAVVKQDNRLTNKGQDTVPDETQ